MAEDPIDNLTDGMDALGKTSSDDRSDIAIEGTGMPGDSADKLVDEVEKKPKMFFDELSDIALMQVFDKLDLRSRLAMRLVSKRMKGIEQEVKNNVEKICLDIAEGTLTVKPWGDGLVLDWYLTSCSTTFGPKCLQSKNLHGMEDTLSRLALNTRAHKIQLIVQDDNAYLANIRIINLLFNFEADEIAINTPFINLNELKFSAIASFAERFKTISIYSGSLTAGELCLVRKMMIEDKFKAETFLLSAEHLPQEFLKECFGVTIEDKENSSNFGRIFRATNESIELRAKGHGPHLNVLHYDGNFKTTIFGNLIAFVKYQDGAKPDEESEKVEFNRFYEYVYSSYEDDDDYDDYEYEYSDNDVDNDNDYDYPSDD